MYYNIQYSLIKSFSDVSQIYSSLLITKIMITALDTNLYS